MEIPTYRIVVDENDEKGVYAISLVDEPAIQKDFFKLANVPFNFEFKADKDEQVLYGPLLIPDKLIFRSHNGVDFNIIFEKKTIQTISDKFNKNKLGDSLNFMHSDKEVKGYMLENWIIEDSENDKSNKYTKELPNGTWYGKFKIEDKQFWNQYVKTEVVRGFSVELNVTELELLELKELNKKNVQNMEKETNDLKENQESLQDVSLEEHQQEVQENGKEQEVQEEEPQEKEKTIEEQVNEILEPVMEKFQNTLDSIGDRLNELEAKMVEKKDTEDSEESKEETPGVQEFSELKKEVLELKEILSKEPSKNSIDKSNDIKSKNEQMTLSKIERLIKRRG